MLVPPNISCSEANPPFCAGQRKRKLDTDNLKDGDAPPTKVARPSSPTTFGPGEMFFKVDEGTK